MWNDTEIPLAVLFTFRCYGTWLHGDERGSVDRHRNVFGTPRIPQIDGWRDYNQELLEHPPVLLDAKMRRAVEKAIRELCEKRGWRLLAINVRTNHVHVVIGIGGKNEDQVLIAVKANSTKQMRSDSCWPNEHSPWADKGSKRKLWNERSIANAVDYVVNGQGFDLPDFDY